MIFKQRQFFNSCSYIDNFLADFVAVDTTVMAAADLKALFSTKYEAVGDDDAKVVGDFSGEQATKSTCGGGDSTA